MSTNDKGVEEVQGATDGPAEKNAGENTSPVAAPPGNVSAPDLKEAIIKQVEYYFSRQNLATDKYLLSQMNSEMFVPVQTVARFKLVQLLSHDVSFITSCLEESKSLVLDSTKTMIRPNFTLKRSTLILRDIPQSTPEDEVKAIFKDCSECGTIESVRSDIGDTWFVVFEGEEQAIAALQYTHKAAFNGKPIHARIKSESALKLISGTDAAASSQQPRLNPYATPFFAPPQYGNPYAGAYQPTYPSYDPQFQPRAPYVRKGEHVRGGMPGGRGQWFRGRGGMMVSGGGNMYQQQNMNPQGGMIGGGMRGQRGGGGVPYYVQGGHMGQPGMDEMGYVGPKQRQPKRKMKKGDMSMAGGAHSFDMGAQHFPPLPSKVGGSPGKSDQPLQTYSVNEIMAVLESIKDPPVPVVIDKISIEGVILSEPNLLFAAEAEDEKAPVPVQVQEKGEAQL